MHFSIGISSQSSYIKRNKRHPNRKVRSEIFSAEDTILSMKNLRCYTKKLLELVSKFCKVA
jgi:hypothetical protein